MKDPFRVYVYTRHGLGIPAPDIQTELTAIHGDASPSLRTIFRWIAEIKSGTFEYQKKSGPGRPVSSTTPEKIREIKSEIEQNCRLSCRELSTIVNLDKSAVYNVLTQHLDLRNVFSVWERDLLWQMDNARPHTSRLTQDYVTKIGFSLVKQSPYSPDMNLRNRYLFRILKQDLKQEALGSASEVQKAVQRCFRRLSENTLADQLLKLRDHCGHVVSSGGDYISSQ